MNYTKHPLHQPKNEEDKERGYTEDSKWHGKLTFRCIHCPFDTFKESDIVHHLFTRHQMGSTPDEAPQTRPAEALLFGASGDIVREIPVAPPSEPEVPTAGVTTKSPRPRRLVDLMKFPEKPKGLTDA